MRRLAISLAAVMVLVASLAVARTRTARRLTVVLGTAFGAPIQNLTAEELAAFNTSCHTPTLTSGSSEILALDHKTYHPYSDFLLHDMGSLGDGIEQETAKGSEFRTTPLWGLRVKRRFLHDGRVNRVEEAVVAHDGQGRAARERFLALDERSRAVLRAFLLSL